MRTIRLMAFSLTGPVFEEHPHLKGKHKENVRCWATQGLDGYGGGCVCVSNQSMQKGNRMQETPTILSHIYIQIIRMESTSSARHVRSKCMLNLVTNNCQNASAPWCIWLAILSHQGPAPDVLEGADLATRKFPTEHQ